MISVIIPAYKAEATIKKCLKSVENQDFKDYEIIVVKDILGVSKARNQGIEKAKGEFIFFLDTDDVLAENALSNLMRESADLVVSGYTSQNKTTGSYARDYLNAPNRETRFAFVWGKLFKTEIIRRHGIKFSERMNKHEDTEFVFQYVRFCKTIKFVTEKSVIHIQPETGAGFDRNDATEDRERLIDTIAWLIHEPKLFKKCKRTLEKIDKVRSCRKWNWRHPFLSWKAAKRYSSLVIFGAGSTGRLLLGECKKRRIRIECFCDEVEKSIFCGVRVLNPEELKALYPNARMMITTGAVQDVSSKLRKLGYKKILYRKTVKLLRKIKAEGYERFCLENCIDANRNHGNRFFLRSLDLMITERCSLKCQDCSNLMQYYSKPQDLNFDEVMQNFKSVLRLYKVGEVRVIGGEPFINKNWPRFVEALIRNPKIKRIIIYTNGTIKAMHTCLLNSKVFVLITDYGHFSKALPWLRSRYSCMGIQYDEIKPEWSDCGTIQIHDRTPEELEKVFSDCCSKNPTLSGSKIYQCAFAANLARLGVHDGEGISACEYCNGRPLNAQTITPAIQTEKT